MKKILIFSCLFFISIHQCLGMFSGLKTGAKGFLGLAGFGICAKPFAESLREHIRLKSYTEDVIQKSDERNTLDPEFVKFVDNELMYNGIDPNRVILFIRNSRMNATHPVGNKHLLIFSTDSYFTLLLSLKNADKQEAIKISQIDDRVGFESADLRAFQCCQSTEHFRDYIKNPNNKVTFRGIIDEFYKLPDCCRNAYYAYKKAAMKNIIDHESNHIRNNDYSRITLFSALSPLSCLAVYGLLYKFNRSAFFQLPSALALSAIFPYAKAKYRRYIESKADEAVRNDPKVLEAAFHSFSAINGIFNYLGNYPTEQERALRFKERLDQLAKE